MASYLPPDQEPYGTPPPPQQYAYNAQQYSYNAQQQPAYKPADQQQQWGENQGVQQQYFGAPSGPPQGQPTTGVMPPSYETAPYGAVNTESGLPAKFNPRPRYNDCWAFLLFIAQLAAFVVLSYFAIHEIHVTFALSIIASLAAAVYYFVRHQWMPAIFGLIFGLLYASMWFFWKSRIPFATEMLIAVTAISKKYPATFAVAFLGLFVQTAYSAYFMTVISGCYALYYDTTTGTTPGKLQALIVFCFFSFYWTSQVIRNVVHVTVSGVYACYYFLMGSPQGMSKSPTIESFKRACTTSIGSICFGSLIIAAIQTFRALAQMLRADSDGFLAFIACIIDCILGCLQGIIEYVNKYAFCQVAIYGKPFIPAAKDTWTILKDRGIVQLINDNLIGNVWAMGAIMSGMLSALASYLYLWFDDPPFNYDNEFTYVIVTMAFVMGLQMLFTVGSVIDSGVATTFVCLAEDPAALARTKPELFERIRVTWPAVVQGVNY
ncbi:putative choline transporter, neither null mutation nor overexpression affects choline transport [Dissophora ornata]|nr:putative choline transporter, neither null mutation nor overexpression affects choline transport [Dissophora ornata]